MSELRFYFDESVELAASEQLARIGIDVVSAHSLDKLGDKDLQHLQRATEMGRVFCTYDDGFLELASQGIEHAGIVFAQHQTTTIGDWVRELRSLHATLNAAQATGQVFWLKTR